MHNVSWRSLRCFFAHSAVHFFTPKSVECSQRGAKSLSLSKRVQQIDLGHFDTFFPPEASGSGAAKIVISQESGVQGQGINRPPGRDVNKYNIM